MSKLLLYILALFVLGGCSGKESEAQIPKKHNKTYTHLKVYSPVKTLPLSDTLPQALKDWEAFWKTKFSYFSLDKFYLYSVTSLSAEVEYSHDDSLESARNIPYFIFSSDSFLALDIYSFRWTLGGYDGHLTLEGAEPESTVELVNLKTKRGYRYEFCGTPCYFEEAGWVDKSTFFMAGHTERDYKKNLYQGFFTIYDLKRKTEMSFYSKNYHFVTPSDFIKYKFSKYFGVTVY